MKTKLTITLTIIALFVSGVFYSCQQKQKKESIGDKAETALNRLEEKLDSLSTDDPNFQTKLEADLEQFNETMEDLGDKLENTGTDVNDKVKEKLNEIRGKSQSLSEKLKEWKNKASDNLKEVGNEIKDEYNDLKEALKKDK